MDSGWRRFVPGVSIVFGYFRGVAAGRRTLDVFVAEGGSGADLELSIDEAVGDERTWERRVVRCPGVGGTRVPIEPDATGSLCRIVGRATGPTLVRVKIEGGGMTRHGA